jgi:pseudaminic acid synthase
MTSFAIGQRRIGPEHPPLIIAELSGNHNGSLDRGLAIIDAAAAAGAHAIKLQTYTADTMTLPGAHRISDPASLWYDRELYELYQEAYTPWEWHAPLFERARQRGLLAFSSPFDETAVDFLETLDVPAYKIASLENTDWPLLRRVAATGKPVIMSTGASTLAEVADAVDVLRAGGCRQLTLLKCTSTYPALPTNTHLRTIPHLAQLFPDCLIGLSDHTAGIGASVAAVALGASVVEKHLTLRRADGGVDAAFSLEPEEFHALVVETERAWQALGQIQYGVQRGESNARSHKRSIYVAADIAAGEPYTAINLRIVRPGDGLAPRYYDQLLGKPARQALRAGTPLTWDAL